MTLDDLFFRRTMTAVEEAHVQNLIECGEIDQAIAIYENLKPYSARTLHLLGVLHAEKKGDPYSAISYFQEALQIKDEVMN